MSSKQQGPAGGGKRTKTTEKRLKMYATRAKRDKNGKVVWEAFKSKSTDHIARIQPDRRWFGPSRTATPEAIDKFREQVKNVVDPYHESKDADPSNTNPAPLTPGSTVARHTYLLKQAKIPYSLLHTRDHFPNAINNRILDVESYASTFGPKNTRKRPKVAASDYSELLKRVENTQESYKEDADRNIKVELEYKEQQGDAVLTAGQSNRIHNELHKVIDASDVLIQVLDARDPEGTRSRWLEKYLRKEHPHKHLVLLLNKCDLVPQKVTKQWLGQFSREYPCLAFHASLQRPFGKGALIQILRQFQQLHAKDKQQISVGFVGYPNVGKSSVINTLRHKKVCNVAPLPGETKVWQYITLFKRVFLIDCPGVVTAVDVAKHNTVLEDQYQLLHQGQEGDETRDQTRDQPGTNVVSEKEAALVLKGVVRIENLTDPVSYIGPLLTRVNLEYMQRVYQCEVSTNHVTFLETLAKQKGKLLKGGHPDITRVARIVLNDWLRGKIPFYTKPSGMRDTVRSKDLDQLRAPSQLIDNIPVKEDFKELFHEEFEDDAEVMEDGADEDEDGDEDEEVASADEDDAALDDEAPVDWDAVYASVNPEQDFNTIHQHENKGAKNSSVGLPKSADLPKLELVPMPAEDSEGGSARGRGRQGKVAGKVEKKQRGKAKKKSQLKSEDEIKSLLRTLESIEGTANLHGAGPQYKNRNASGNKKKRARSEQAEDFEIVPQESRVKRRKVTPRS